MFNVPTFLRISVIGFELKKPESSLFSIIIPKDSEVTYCFHSVQIESLFKCFQVMILFYIVLLCNLTQALVKLPIIQGDISLIEQSQKKRDLVSVQPIYNVNVREYLITLGVGTPIQLFNVTLDTGSSDLWIPSSQCTQCPSIRFAESKSSTFNQTARNFDAEYGSGSAKGTTGYDTITLGELTCPDQILGLAFSTSGTINQGILGLGFPGVMTTGDEPLIIHLARLQVIPEAVFSIYLGQQADTQGEIVIGGYETDRFTGQLAFLPVLRYNPLALVGKSYQRDGIYKYWSLPFQAITVMHLNQGEIYTSRLEDLEPAILDTGATLSYLPQPIVLGILKSIAKSNYKPIKTGGRVQAYEVNCAYFSQPLHLLFQFSTQADRFSTWPVEVQVPLKDLVLQNDKNCLFGLAPSVTTDWILGQTVLRSAYIVHDMLGLQVGIGKPFRKQ
ncbi:unnamed protein product [Rhizopus stolonifer]